MAKFLRRVWKAGNLLVGRKNEFLQRLSRYPVDHWRWEKSVLTDKTGTYTLRSEGGSVVELACRYVPSPGWGMDVLDRMDHPGEGHHYSLRIDGEVVMTGHVPTQYRRFGDKLEISQWESFDQLAYFFLRIHTSSYQRGQHRLHLRAWEEGKRAKKRAEQAAKDLAAQQAEESKRRKLNRL